MQLRKWIPVILILFAFIFIWILDLPQHLSWQTIQTYHTQFMSYTHQHYLFSVLLFMVIYIICVIISLPGASILTVLGGFLFGMFWGTIYVVISATTGAYILFTAVKLAANAWMIKQAAPYLTNMREGFKKNALSYLLFMRLIPLFPFWIVNIVPALLDVSTPVFLTATFFGIIPGTLIYVFLGNGLEKVLDENSQLNIQIIFSPHIFLPLLLLALFALLPIIYRLLRSKHR